MASVDQATFIKDLVLQKHRNFAEFKKWLATTGIVRTNGQIFSKSINLKETINRITPSQASAIIDSLQLLGDVPYQMAYDQDSIDKSAALMKSIDEEIQSWTFI